MQIICTLPMSGINLCKILLRDENQVSYVQLLTFLIHYLLYYRYWNHEFCLIEEEPHFHVPEKKIMTKTCKRDQ